MRSKKQKKQGRQLLAILKHRPSTDFIEETIRGIYKILIYQPRFYRARASLSNRLIGNPEQPCAAFISFIRVLS
jgi:hypothetical protein